MQNHGNPGWPAWLVDRHRGQPTYVPRSAVSVMTRPGCRFDTEPTARTGHPGHACMNVRECVQMMNAWSRTDMDAHPHRCGAVHEGSAGTTMPSSAMLAGKTVGCCRRDSVCTARGASQKRSCEGRGPFVSTYRGAVHTVLPNLKNGLPAMKSSPGAWY